MKKQRTSLFAGLLLAALFAACGEQAAKENQLGSIGTDGRAADGMVPRSHDVNAGASNEAQAVGSHMDAASKVNDVRSEMLAELEAVRARLNMGDAPAVQHRVDTKRAAALAIGLERAERTNRLLEATEEGWPLGRDTIQDAVADLQAWWDAHDREDIAVVN